MEEPQKRVASRCEGYSKGVRCCRTIEKRTFCEYHSRPIRPRERKHDCEICTSSVPISEMKWFACDHGMCKTCVLQLRSCVCPFCRADILNVLTPKEILAINRKIDDDASEAAMNDERYAIVVADEQTAHMLENDEFTMAFPFMDFAMQIHANLQETLLGVIFFDGREFLDGRRRFRRR